MGVCSTRRPKADGVECVLSMHIVPASGPCAARALTAVSRLLRCGMCDLTRLVATGRKPNTDRSCDRLQSLFSTDIARISSMPTWLRLATPCLIIRKFQLVI